MDSAILVRALHVPGVVLWIGGVALVGAVLLTVSLATVMGAVAGAHGWVF